MGALYREFILKNKCLHGMNAQLTDMGVLVPDHLVVVRTRGLFLTVFRSMPTVAAASARTV